jgi:hypothetical protein
MGKNYVTLPIPTVLEGDKDSYKMYTLICGLLMKRKATLETSESFELRTRFQSVIFGEVGVANFVDNSRDNKFIVLTLKQFMKYFNAVVVNTETEEKSRPITAKEMIKLCINCDASNAEFASGKLAIDIDISDFGLKFLDSIDENKLSKRSGKIKKCAYRWITFREAIVKCLSSMVNVVTTEDTDIGNIA